MVIPKAKKEDLANFVRNDIIPLEHFSSLLNSFGEYLRKEMSGRDTSFISERLQKVILGGVQKNGSFAPNSLAEFYNEYFGIGLSQTDRVRYVNSVNNGVKPQNIVIKSDPNGKIADINTQNNFSMFHFIVDINNLCTTIVKKSIAKGIIPQITEVNVSSFKEEEGEALIDNPSQVLSQIKDFYNASLKILPTYNDYSMFLYSITNIPKDYLIEAYPSIAGEFSNLTNILDLEIKPIVELPITSNYMECVFSKQDGIASAIGRLIGSIFDLSFFMTSKPNTLFEGATDEYTNFLKNGSKSLNGILDAIGNAIIKRRDREIYIEIDEKGFSTSYVDEYNNQHVSAFSKSISPLLFSGVVSLGTSNRSIILRNHLAGVMQ